MAKEVKIGLKEWCIIFLRTLTIVSTFTIISWFTIRGAELISQSTAYYMAILLLISLFSYMFLFFRNEFFKDGIIWDWI